MSDSTHTLDDFKKMLSRTFDPSCAEELSEGFDDFELGETDVKQEAPVMELSEGFDDFELRDTEESVQVDTSPVVQPAVNTVTQPVQNTVFVGLQSVKLVSKPLTLQDEIQNTICNLGFTADSCIEEFNAMYNGNWSSMEEIYSQILYNNYFKRIAVADIKTLSAADLLGNGEQVKEVTYENVVEEVAAPKLSKIEEELNAVEYSDFIVQAAKSGRITDAAFERYGDLYKALYMADYLEAFGTEAELGDNSDVIYAILVGRYLCDMTDIDYKKIMYLTGITDMCSLIMEKGSVDSYADITGYKLSKLLGIDIEITNCQKFFVAKSNKMMGYSLDLVWHNFDILTAAVEGCNVDVVDGTLLFYDSEYKGEAIPQEIQCETSLTSFVSNPNTYDTFFYYNFNKLLDMINHSDLDIPDSTCDFISNMDDLTIAHYDGVIGNIVKYNPELLGIFASRYYKVLLSILRFLPGREPTAYVNYRLLSFALLRIFKDKVELVSKNMTAELKRDSASIDIVGIANVNMLSFEEFWANFDSILTYMSAASKVTISIFNSVARLKIS